MADALHTALALDGPFAPVSARHGEGVPVPDEPSLFELGRSHVVREGDDVAILAFGRMVSRAVGAGELLAERGVQARVVDMRWVKPLDVQAIAAAARTKLVVTVEGGVLAGGVGEGVLAELARMGSSTPALTMGIPDEFVPQGKVDLLLHDLGPGRPRHRRRRGEAPVEVERAAPPRRCGRACCLPHTTCRHFESGIERA